MNTSALRAVQALFLVVLLFSLKTQLVSGQDGIRGESGYSQHIPQLYNKGEIADEGASTDASQEQNEIASTDDLWTSQTVDNNTRYADDVALALDSQDKPHVSYLYRTDEDSPSTYHLRYGTSSDNAWAVEQVTTQPVNRLGNVSLVIDRSDVPHIVYSIIRGQTLTITHSYKSNDLWRSDIVDVVQSGGCCADLFTGSLLVDSKGSLHLFYRIASPDYKHQELRYADLSAGTWHTATLYSAEWFIYFAAAIDASDQFHLLYRATENEIPVLEYATFATIAQFSPQPFGPAVGHKVSQFTLSFDGTGTPSVIFTADTEVACDSTGYSRLYLAQKSPTGWTKTEIDRKRYASLSLAIGPENDVHIVATVVYGCRYDTTHQLEYIHNNGTAWEHTVVRGTTQHPSALLMDRLGKLHIAAIGFYSGTNAKSWVVYSQSQSVLGFLPNPDGYSFDNYGASHISWEVFRDAFGAENVERVGANGVPERRIFADLRYNSYQKSGENGLCFGMSATSVLLYKDWGAPPVEASSTYSLPNPVDSPAVGDFIEKYHLYQTGKQWTEEKSKAWERSLKDEIALILASIDGGLEAPRLISLYGPAPKDDFLLCGSHAVVPYAYSRQGDDVRISVYDPNHPGSRIPEIRVNTKSETWEYDGPVGLWKSGQLCQPNPRNPLQIGSRLISAPASVLQETPIPTWPQWFGNAAVQVSVAPAYQLITVDSASTLLITDAQGRALGNRDGELVEEIPGSYLDIPLSGLPGIVAEYPESYVISGTTPLTVTMQHNRLGQTTLTAYLGGNGLVMLEGSVPDANTQDSVSLASDASSVSLESGFDSTGRTLAIGSAQADADMIVTVQEFRLPADQSATLSVAPTWQVMTFTVETPTGYQLLLEKESSENSVQFSVTVPSRMGVQVLAIDWDHLANSLLSTDEDADGQADEVVPLADLLAPPSGDGSKRLLLPLVRL